MALVRLDVLDSKVFQIYISNSLAVFSLRQVLSTNSYCDCHKAYAATREAIGMMVLARRDAIRDVVISSAHPTAGAASGYQSASEEKIYSSADLSVQYRIKDNAL
jgi:hypothetical protein